MPPPVEHLYRMGEYFVGDVVLAPLRIGDHAAPKNRPAIVTGVCDGGTLRVCPVTSKKPVDAPFKTLDLLDFARGGLDLFDESYVLVSLVCTIRKTDVVGKKGTLTEESLGTILSMIAAPASHKKTQYR